MSAKSKIRLFLHGLGALGALAICLILFFDREFRETISTILLIHIFFALRSAHRANKARSVALSRSDQFRELEETRSKWRLVLGLLVIFSLDGGILAVWAFISVTFALKLTMSLCITWWVIHDILQGGQDEAGMIIMPPLLLILQWIRVRGYILMAMLIWWWLNQPEAALIVMLGGSWIDALWELETGALDADN